MEGVLFGAPFLVLMLNRIDLLRSPIQSLANCFEYWSRFYDFAGWFIPSDLNLLKGIIMKNFLIAGSLLILGATNSYAQEYLEIVNQCARSLSVARSNFGSHHNGSKNPYYVSRGWGKVESGKVRKFYYDNKSYKGIRINYFKNGSSRTVNLKNEKGFDRIHRLCASKSKFRVLDFYWASSPGVINLLNDRHYSDCDRISGHSMKSFYVFRYGNRTLYINCGD